MTELNTSIILESLNPNFNAKKELSEPTCIKVSQKRKKKNRCNFEGCNKKLTITSFECQCLKKFCPIHRLPENHECTFDYVNDGKEKIKKNNPIVINSKINKI